MKFNLKLFLILSFINFFSAIFGLVATAAGNTPAPLPGMPVVLDPNDIYSADRPNNLSSSVLGIKELVYVPNHSSNTVSVIDPKTYKVIKTFKTNLGPQHVVPSWDLKTIWVNNNQGNTITPINPANLVMGKPIYVHDPYNLYFTPNGQYAIEMAEKDKVINFLDPQSLSIKKSVKVPCAGVNHADFSADGNFFIATCEFDGSLILMDTQKEEFISRVSLPRTFTRDPMPQDIKLSPNGKTFFIADMMSNGIWLMPANKFGEFSYMATGKDAHGLYITRDSKNLLITNRGEGSVSVFDFAQNRLTSKWKIPGGGSPDMGGITEDGKQFWVSGRYNGVVYVFDIEKGRFLRKIKVGREPHGLAIFPQPGRYSLGHTGIFR